MPLLDRAAQFSPFAALTGYDGIIAETGRLTERSVDLDEGAIAELNAQLRAILPLMDTQPTVTVTYFQPDQCKEGGSYISKTGQLKKLDTARSRLVFTDRAEIPFARLLSVALAE